MSEDRSDEAETEILDAHNPATVESETADGDELDGAEGADDAAGDAAYDETEGADDGVGDAAYEEVDAEELGEGWVDEGTEAFAYSDGTEVPDDEVADGHLYDAPPLPAGVSVAVAGVLCGLATVGLVWLSGRGCDAASGAPNCGSLGLPLLLATVLVTIALGVLMLRRLMLPNPGLVSFLGVCFMLLIVVGLLSGRLLSPWMLVVVPAISAATFVAARYVTRSLNA